MSQKSFARILEEKIKTSIAPRPSQTYDPAYLSFLMGQIATTRLRHPHQVKSYQKSATTHARPVEEGANAVEPALKQEEQQQPLRPSHEFSAEQEEALELLLDFGALLPKNFFEAELKQSFRRLAYRLHPDTCMEPQHQNGMSFIEAKKAYDLLRQLFSADIQD